MTIAMANMDFTFPSEHVDDPRLCRARYKDESWIVCPAWDVSLLAHNQT